MTNPCEEMTSYQEAMQELRDNVVYLKEQLREAYKIIAEVHEEFDYRYDGLKDSGTLWMGELLDQSREWLDQNESIAKGQTT